MLLVLLAFVLMLQETYAKLMAEIGDPLVATPEAAGGLLHEEAEAEWLDDPSF